MTEQQTENVRLILGTGDKLENPVVFYLIIGFGYLSVETMDARDADALVTVRELMAVCTLALKNGVSLQNICDALKYHQDGRGELRPTNTPYVPAASSVPDLIGRYLENRLIKMPIIKRILARGINPCIALDKDGRLYLDWPVEKLREESKKIHHAYIQE